MAMIPYIIKGFLYLKNIATKIVSCKMYKYAYNFCRFFKEHFNHPLKHSNMRVNSRRLSHKWMLKIP